MFGGPMFHIMFMITPNYISCDIDYMDLLPLRLMFSFIYKINVSESTPTRQYVSGPFQEDFFQVVAYRSERSMLGEETLEDVLASLAYAIQIHLDRILFQYGCIKLLDNCSPKQIIKLAN